MGLRFEIHEVPAPMDAGEVRVIGLRFLPIFHVEVRALEGHELEVAAVEAVDETVGACARGGRDDAGRHVGVDEERRAVERHIDGTRRAREIGLNVPIE